MEGRLLSRAREKLDERRRINGGEELRRRDAAYARIPELREIEARLRSIMTELVGLALGVATRSAREMQSESLALQARRALLLRQAGFDEHYLDERYSCPVCQDRGWLEDGSPCACLIALYKQEQTAELSPLLKSGDESFESFRLDYYSTTPLREGEPSPRKQMERIYQICRRYAESFGPDSGSLLFTGAPGLGKTFLSASIARLAAAGGRSVAYDTAAGLLSAFETEKFSRDEDVQSDAASRVRQLKSCDLLILDDLGTEMPNAFTQSALYTLLDGRLRERKSTVISTNLSREALRERYGAPLYSRLSGEYQWLTFLGRDIRSLRKEQV